MKKCKNCSLSKSPADCVIPFISQKYKSVRDMIKNISSKCYYKFWLKRKLTELINDFVVTDDINRKKVKYDIGKNIKTLVNKIYKLMEI